MRICGCTSGWLAALLAVQLWSRYRYFKQGARADYTLRRLPQRHARFRYCWSLPLLEAAAILLLMVVMLLLFYGYYMASHAGCVSGARTVAEAAGRQAGEFCGRAGMPGGMEIGDFAMIELKHVTKKYRNKTALEDVSLCFPQGEIVGLFGENGAGKTTLMKSILGFLKYSGEITLDGEKIDWRNIGRIAFATSEHSFFPAMDAEGHKAFYQEHFGTFKEKRFDALMEFFELPANRVIGKFSTGQKNQFEVLLALSQGADYILMDEPFAGNDIFNREDFYKVLLGLLEPSETVILSTHLIEEVENFVGRAVLLHKGKVIGDLNVEEIRESGRTLVELIKESYRYRVERVGQAIAKMEEES